MRTCRYGDTSGIVSSLLPTLASSLVPIASSWHLPCGSVTIGVPAVKPYRGTCFTAQWPHHRLCTTALVHHWPTHRISSTRPAMLTQKDSTHQRTMDMVEDGLHTTPTVHSSRHHHSMWAVCLPTRRRSTGISGSGGLESLTAYGADAKGVALCNASSP